MKPLLSLAASALLYLPVSGQNSLPVVTGVTATRSLTGYSISYRLTDAEHDKCTVYIRASIDGGKTYRIKPLAATGDVGEGISEGNHTITWTGNLLAGQMPGTSIIFKVMADDGYRPSLQEISSKIDSNRIYRNFLAVYGNNSPANPEHYRQTRETISSFYQGLGLQTELDTFFSNVPDEIVPVREGINILATIEGMDGSDSTILMSGHYDTVEDTPGADDNNMSVAICMEAATVLKDYTFHHNLKFAQWDLEEIGLLGAYYYALSAKSLDTKAVVNFDGMSIYKEEPNSQSVPTGFDLLFPAGYQKAEADSFRGNFITMITDFKSAGLSQRAVELAPQVTPTLKYVDLTCPDPNCLVAADLRRSDHAPFWDRLVPAIFFTSTTEFRSACYHQPCDTVANLNFSTKVLQLATSLMADKAGIMHAGHGFSQQIATGITENQPAPVTVNKPYPNPVDHSCFFEITLTEAADVAILVTDLTGKKTDLVETHLSAGQQTLSWTPSRSIAKGTYVAQVLVNGKPVQSFQLAVAIDPDRLSHGH
ncbi:MAG: M28 family peptidase [Bacteroidota bacterium]